MVSFEILKDTFTSPAGAELMGGLPLGFKGTISKDDLEKALCTGEHPQYCVKPLGH